MSGIIKKILLVEDDEAMAISVRTALEQYGYRVVTAAAAAEAADTAAGDKDISLILADADLKGGFGGGDAAGTIPAGRDIPVVFIVSGNDHDIAVKTENQASFGFYVRGSGALVLDAVIKTAFRLFEADEKLKASMKALREHEEILTLINNSSLDYIYSYDRNGRFTSVNRELCEHLKLSAEEIIGKTNAEIGFTEEECRIWDARFKRVFETDSTISGYTVTVMPDGNIDYYEGSLNPIHDADGKIIGISGTSRNITEKKHAEDEIKAKSEELEAVNEELMASMEEMEATNEELETLNAELIRSQNDLWENGIALVESEKKYREIFINAIEGIYQTTADGVLTGSNPAFAAIFGFSSPGEILEMVNDIGYQLYAHNEDRERLKTLLAQNSRVTGFEAEGRTKKGGQIWVSINAAAVMDDSGKVGKITGSVIDITKRKQAEDSLRKSEEKFKRIFENMQDVFYQIDGNGTITEITPSIKKYSGYDREELIGTNIGRVYFDTHEREVFVDSIMKNGEVFDYELHLKDKYGNEVITSANSHILLDSAGRPAGVEGTLRDITSQKQTEEKLSSTLQQMNDIIEFLPDPTMIIDQSSRVFVWNRSIEQMTGVKKETMLGQGGYAYAVPFYRERRPILIDLVDLPDDEVKMRYDQVQRVGNILYMETFIPHMNQNRGIYIWAAAATLFDSAGRRIGAIEVIRDITDRKRGEQALRSSEETFRALTENSIDVIMRFDREGRHLYVNPAVEKQGSIPASGFIGKTHRELGFPEDLCEQWGNSINKVFEAGTVERVLSQLPNGKWIDWLLMPEFDENGNVKAVLTSSRDFTDYKKLEQQLQHAQKMETVGNLAGGLAHDFNNILSGIMGPISLINHLLDKNSGINTDTLRNYVDMMFRSCKRATDIIQQLLSLSRKRNLEFEPVDLNVSIENVMKICENSFDKSVQLLPVYTGYPAFISADQTQIEQVLLNLCINGAHAMTIMKGNGDRWGGDTFGRP